VLVDSCSSHDERYVLWRELALLSFCNSGISLVPGHRFVLESLSGISWLYRRGDAGRGILSLKGTT
jgi:hypothetical protein